ncbi:hypothetical protein SAMN04489737_1138 [Arcanobacterium phocae]|uniref:Uncharacterized protein n=2 Tax=Arcanobacterium phocae TaxID=131112 RepID=A0A1H2LIJ9_9ACTO|nr:hypothetical protein SAMN04489737_1138 [Arcanobacterium phocae]
MSGNIQNATDFQLAPGEQAVYGDKFLTSLFTPYMPTQLMCSTTRFVYKAPNAILGLIPLGGDQSIMPIANIAAVNTSQKLYIGRAFAGGLAFIIGLASLSAPAFGALLMLFGATLLLTCFPAVLQVQNPAGGKVEIAVSFVDQAKLKKFATELQNRVFADQAQVRHDQAQDMRAQQAMLAQLTLQQQMMANQNAQNLAQQNQQNPPAPQM